MFLKSRRTLAKLWLCPLLVWKQDEVAGQKDLVLHFKVAMKELGRRKKYFQRSIFDLSLIFPMIQKDKSFTMNGRQHIHTHKISKWFKSVDCQKRGRWAEIGRDLEVLAHFDQCDIFLVLGFVLVQKIREEIFLKFIKILNHNKS